MQIRVNPDISAYSLCLGLSSSAWRPPLLHPIPETSSPFLLRIGCPSIQKLSAEGERQIVEYALLSVDSVRRQGSTHQRLHFFFCKYTFLQQNHACVKLLSRAKNGRRNIYKLKSITLSYWKSTLPRKKTKKVEKAKSKKTYFWVFGGFVFFGGVSICVFW